MSDKAAENSRDQADALRRVLRQRRRGEPVDLNVLNNVANGQRVRALLESLDRVESAREEVEADPCDADILDETAELVVDGYELLRPIDIGGFGVVRQARRVADDARVAIKFLRCWRNPDASDRRRFYREVAIQRELHHPNIVPILDSGRTAEGVDYFVMPFVDGRPINPIALSRTLTLTKRLTLFATICDAVASAHTRGVIHRDLRPPNILLDGEGRPHLIDFGIATDVRAQSIRRTLATTGKNFGVFLWCSYEQAEGKPLTPASDVFSLGVLLHQLLLGRFPPDVLRVLETVVEHSPHGDNRSTFVGDVNLREDLQCIIRKCLARDPAERYADAGELGRAIADTLNCQPPRPRRRRWHIVSGLVLAAVAGSFAAWYLLRPRPVVMLFSEFGRPPLILRTPNGPDTRMHYLAAGTVRVGESPSFVGLVDEMPRQVTIDSAFYIADREVCQALYEEVMGSNPSRFKGANLPVERVSYLDALEFCKRLSQREGRVYRLPTEAEWEYACRAGTDTTFCFGDDPNLLARYANVADLSNTQDTMAYRSPWNDRNPHTAPVATFMSNRWQLHDMHGNVWEWCQGPYLTDPRNPATAVANHASVRGGSWWDDPGTCRSSNRNPLPLEKKTSTIGFRIVCEVESQTLSQ